MKGKIIVKIEGRPEVYKDDIEVATYKKIDTVIINAIAEMQTSSPYNFNDIDPYGRTLSDEEGRLWEVDFVEDKDVAAYMKEANDRADRREANRKMFESLTDEEKKDIVEVDGRKYIKKIYDANYDRENTTQVKFKLNKRTDADILDKLEEVPNKQAYFKALVRLDIAYQRNNLQTFDINGFVFEGFDYNKNFVILINNDKRYILGRKYVNTISIGSGVIPEYDTLVEAINAVENGADIHDMP